MDVVLPRPQASYNLGAIVMGEFSGSVTSVTYTAPVLKYSGVDLGAQAIQDSINADGVWASSVIPQLGEASTGWLANTWAGATGNATYRYPNAKLQITMRRKNGIGFDPDVAQSLSARAADSYGTKLAAFSEWAVTVKDAVTSTVQDLKPGQIIDTAGSYWQKKQEEIARIGLGPAFGLPGWLLPTITISAAGFVGLYALGTVTQAKKAFFGDAPSRRKRSKKRKS